MASLRLVGVCASCLVGVPPGFKPLHKEEGGAYGEGGGGVRMKTEGMGSHANRSHG